MLPTPFIIFARFFWLISIIVNFLNVLRWWTVSKKVLVEHPELAGEYGRLMKGWLFWGNIPWVVMGVGCMFDGLIVFDYFRPRDGNPFVMAWFCVIFVLWILGFRWIVLANGAEQLARCPGWTLHPQISKPLHVKLLVCLGLTGGIAGTVLLFTLKIPHFIPQ